MTIQTLYAVQPELIRIVRSSNIVALHHVLTFIAAPIQFAERARLCHSMIEPMDRMMKNIEPEVV